MPPADITLDYILESRAVTTLFQPLVSIKRKALFGMEALSRGVSPNGKLIPPNILFQMVENDIHALIELDRLCREKALENFAPIHKKNRAALVSINIDAAIINSLTARSNHLLDAAKKYSVNPNNIIIEIIESKAADMNLLMEFVVGYKQNGFLIALDDVGAGHSNLDRIPLLKPHLLKIDRGLIRGIDTLFHKQEILKALKQMASKVGSMVLAEGVETEAEALTCMSMGIEFFQGFFFAKPNPSGSMGYELDRRLDMTATRFRSHTMDRIMADRRRSERHRSIARQLSDELFDLPSSEFNTKFIDFLARRPTIECIYILDRNGIQISETFCNPGKLDPGLRFIYEPASKGADHSLKEYYLPLKAGLGTFTTEPYISLASGNRCTTIAAFFRDATGKKRILCVDLDCGNKEPSAGPLLDNHDQIH